MLFGAWPCWALRRSAAAALWNGTGVSTDSQWRVKRIWVIRDLLVLLAESWEAAFGIIWRRYTEDLFLQVKGEFANLIEAHQLCYKEIFMCFNEIVSKTFFSKSTASSKGDSRVQRQQQYCISCFTCTRLYTHQQCEISEQACLIPPAILLLSAPDSHFFRLHQFL